MIILIILFIILLIILIYLFCIINNENFNYLSLDITSYNNILNITNNKNTCNSNNCDILPLTITDNLDKINELNTKLNTKLNNKLNTELNTKLNTKLNNKLNSELNSELYNKLNSELYNKLNVEVNNKLNNKIDTEIIYNNRIQLNTTNPYLNIEQNLISNNKIDSSNCCLVTKNFNGDYYYDYEKMSGEKCNIDLYNLNKNRELLFDGVNEWSNDYCDASATKPYIGSCRNNNFECYDFINENQCNDYKNSINKNSDYFLKFNKKLPFKNKNNITWSSKTCEERLEYIPHINNIQ